jgi:hypothetical protein
MRRSLGKLVVVGCLASLLCARGSFHAAKPASAPTERTSLGVGFREGIPQDQKLLTVYERRAESLGSQEFQPDATAASETPIRPGALPRVNRPIHVLGSDVSKWIEP